jgi:hypothetical protein
MFNHRYIYPPTEAMRAERLWGAALTLLRKATIYPYSIKGADVTRLLGNSETARRLTRAQIIHLESEIQRDSTFADRSISDPWPAADNLDLKVGGGPAWIFWTQEQTLVRVRAVVEDALKGYQILSSTLFSAFQPHLETAVLLPARFVGYLRPGRPERGGFTDGPGLEWYLEPLPQDMSTVVDIQVGDPPFWNDPDFFEAQSTRIRILRPAAQKWAHASQHGIAWFWLFDPSPAYELMLNWLWSDLKDLGWVHSPMVKES